MILSFDLDGTIADKAFSEKVWLEGIPEEVSRRHGVDLAHARARVLSAYREVGEWNLLWYDIRYWLKRFDLPILPETLLERYEHHIRFLPHAKELLEESRTRFRLILVSNASRLFIDVQKKALGLERYFERFISATSDYSTVKDERFFRRLCDNLSLSPDEIIHVGDHPLFDFAYPSSCGIRAFLVKDGLKEVRDYLLQLGQEEV
jgi:putative hydrolase of the HAD superfamily